MSIENLSRRRFLQTSAGAASLGAAVLSWRGRPALASRGHPGLASPRSDAPASFQERGRGVANAQFRVGEPQDALATKEQGRDALATATAPLAPPNEAIRRAREAALSVLKPSPKDLEHGLELHANSLVFESYGFAPRAAPDGDVIRRAMEAGASEAELGDLREELPMIRMATDERERQEFLEAFRAAGVTCVFQNAGEESNDPLRLIKRLARFTYATDLLRDEVFKAVSPDDIVTAKRQNRLCLYFSANGVPLPQQWHNVRDELGFICVFQQLGIRMMHVTYNRRNPLGDGCGEATDGGLSDFGRAAVAEMNRVGVIVDVAHSGWRTSLDAAKASQQPMVASHTTAEGLHRHIRSKPDEVIRAICDTGGLVGICCISGFLGGAGHIGTFLDHVDYVAKKFGVEHVAIGTDIAYESRHAAAERAKIPKRPAGSPSLPRWEALWPEGSLSGRADPSLAWTNWPLFTVGLVQRGYSDDAIQKILGGNILRVARAVWESRT
ncbi:MAG: dipeptidase [Planctomycetes bacterium]|nr:dipeptidase [Planctomycetota bacterium]